MARGLYYRDFGEFSFKASSVSLRDEFRLCYSSIQKISLLTEGTTYDGEKGSGWAGRSGIHILFA